MDTEEQQIARKMMEVVLERNRTAYHALITRLPATESMALHLICESDRLEKFRPFMEIQRDSASAKFMYDCEGDASLIDVLCRIAHARAGLKLMFKHEWAMTYLICYLKTKSPSQRFVEEKERILIHILFPMVRALGKSVKGWKRLLEIGIIGVLISLASEFPTESSNDIQNTLTALDCLWKLLSLGQCFDQEVCKKTSEIIRPHFARLMATIPKKPTSDTYYLVRSIICFVSSAVSRDAPLALVMDVPHFTEYMNEWMKTASPEERNDTDAGLVQQCRTVLLEASVNPCCEFNWGYDERPIHLWRKCAAESCTADETITRQKISSLKFCSGCKSVCYCSTECQKSHWKSHKNICKNLQKSLKHKNKSKRRDANNLKEFRCLQNSKIHEQAEVEFLTAESEL